MREAERLEAEHDALVTWAEAEGLDPELETTRLAWEQAWTDHLEAKAETRWED